MTLQKTCHYRLYPLFVYILYFLLFGIVIGIIDYFPKGEIGGILKKWVPWNLKVNSLLIIVAILICYRDILGLAKQFINKRGAGLVALFLVAFSIASFIAPRTHRIFYDEDIYANVGQNIALTNQTGYCNYGTFEYGEYYPQWITYNKEPSGWPFLISRAFQLLGTDELYAFLTNNLLFSAGVLVVFFITWHLTGIYFTSLLAALSFALIPHNLIWANTAAAEPSASFFAGLTVLCLIVFLKTQRDRHLFLLAMLIPFACQMRPESMLILLWVMIAFMVLSPRSLINKKVWTFGLLTALFLLPHLLHFYAVSGHTWGAEGGKFSLNFFWNNLYANGAYYLNNLHFPVLLTALAIIGLLCSRELLRWRLLIFLWFLFFWGIFLFFYAGSYRYGADVRFSLLSFMPLSILAGLGGGFILKKMGKTVSGFKTRDAGCGHLGSRILQHGASIIVLVMLLSFLEFLPLVRRVGQEAWGARHDHRYAREFIDKIPRRSIVLTQNPTMLLLWGQNAIQTYAGINDPGLIEHLMKKYQGHVYFHYNYWCNTKNERNRRLCRAIKEKYRLTEIARAYEQDYEYGLYQMSLNK
ncbi:MAG: hypothetical protein BA861_03155 [Desulfobacterales bacterium S3730MH5]|nr:MAG: hypothetical protein BA861_03155 [Desulfobacterales bacterium S3730MH5]OEU83314.1 MAG: hypothetical protein BA865_06720 [Desulfobacterales bacterium S5133MH4]